ncbi:protein phosphatase 1 regulatory subunit 36 isoform X2 [Brachyhypopomus gauderio]|uniref:protein phosphatase 1 regulatory subunit 36 isoform X2 n=1 Tax=Brachyhypopomus gauderio TaxID=698409 RepID=UPI0040429095
MSKLQNETVSAPPTGRWRWNDETQELEPTCYSTSVETKEKRKNEKSSTYQDHFRNHLEKISRRKISSRGGRSAMKNTAGFAMQNALKATLKRSQRDSVTIDHIKHVAVTLVQEKECLPIPPCFLDVIQSREMDEFLASLLLYLSCHLERKSLEERPKTLMMSRVSSTYRDRHLYECLYSFFCYVAWVTFGRQDLKGIQAEIGYLFRSDAFNPALRAQGAEPEGEEEEPVTTQKEGQSECRQAVTHNRKSQRWPALSGIVTRRSPVMVSFLPSPQEKAPHLFQTSFSHKQQPVELVDSEILMEDLRQQLASFNFGILGKPLSEFSYTTLILHGAKNEGEEGDDEDSGGDDSEGESEGHETQVRGSRPSFTCKRSTIAGKNSSLSRANTVASRVTTEALSSDTE